jgi:hypothetical protein
VNYQCFLSLTDFELKVIILLQRKIHAALISYKWEVMQNGVLCESMLLSQRDSEV